MNREAVQTLLGSTVLALGIALPAVIACFGIQTTSFAALIGGVVGTVHEIGLPVQR